MPTRHFIRLVAKVFGGAAAISVGIKYLGPILKIAPTPGNAIALVVLPPIVLMTVLGLRLLQPPSA